MKIVSNKIQCQELEPSRLLPRVDSSAASSLVGVRQWRIQVSSAEGILRVHSGVATVRCVFVSELVPRLHLPGYASVRIGSLRLSAKIIFVLTFR